DVHLDLDVVAIGEETLDAAVVVVPEDDGGHRLRRIVGAVLLGDDDALAARGVVGTGDCAAGEQHGVDLLVELFGRDAIGVGRAAPTASAATAEAAAAAVGIGGVVLRLHLIVGAAFLGRVEIDRNHRRLSDQNDLAAQRALGGGNPGGHFILG